jgi:pyrimidine-nucleoside phosphorylase
LSKNLAEGSSGPVLDDISGTGAFLTPVDAARSLARLLIETATHSGKHATALLTDMNQPLGNYVGNALEVEESIAVLRGKGAPDLTRLSLELTAHMLVLGATAASVDEGLVEAERLLATGAGLKKFEELVHAQGGDLTRLPKAKRSATVVSPRDGYVATIDTETVGRAAMMLGAGRQTIDDVIDPAAGLIVHQKLTDEVKRGEPLITLHFNDDANLHEVRELVENAYEIADTPPATAPLVHAVLSSAERNL